MKVKELLEELKDCDPEDVVIMAKDGEGNGYSPLADVAPKHKYVPDSTWSGDVYDEENFQDQFDDGDPPEHVNAVILWPVN